MEKKLPRLLICVFLLFLPLLFLFRRPLISVPYQLSKTVTTETDVIVTDVFYGTENVSDLVDYPALLEVLSGYTCRFAPWIQTATRTITDTWEINLVHGGRPIHIVVGEHSYRYQSKESILIFKIIDSDSLQEELNQLLNGQIAKM